MAAIRAAPDQRCIAYLYPQHMSLDVCNLCKCRSAYKLMAKRPATVGCSPMENLTSHGFSDCNTPASCTRIYIESDTINKNPAAQHQRATGYLLFLGITHVAGFSARHQFRVSENKSCAFGLWSVCCSKTQRDASLSTALRIMSD